MPRKEYAAQVMIGRRIDKRVKRAERRKPRTDYFKLTFDALQKTSKKNEELTDTIKKVIELLYTARNNLEDNGRSPLPFDHPIIKSIRELEKAMK